MPSSFATQRERAGADRGERGERAPHAAQRRAVLAAALALAHVPARAAGRLDAAVVGGEQVAPDLAAVGVARLLRLDQPDPRPHEQRLHRGHRDVERAGELRVAEPVDLAHQQRRALLLGQPADVGDEPLEVLAPLRLVDRVEQRLARHLEDLRRRRVRPPQVVDAAVVRDAVEPGAHVDRAAVAAQRPERAHEHVLQHVLGVLARMRREHLAHVREQPLAVAVVEHAERLVGACAEERDELLVGAQPQQRGGKREPTQSSWRVQRGGFHSLRLPRSGGSRATCTLTRIVAGSLAVGKAGCDLVRSVADTLHIRPGLELPLAEVELRTSRSSGPGGQHANVTASRVEATFDVAASEALSDAQKARVTARLGPRVTALGAGHALAVAQPRVGAPALGRAARARARGPPPADRDAADDGVEAPPPRREEAPRRAQARPPLEAGRTRARRTRARAGGADKDRSRRRRPGGTIPATGG